MSFKKEKNNKIFISQIIRVNDGIFCVGEDGQKTFYDAVSCKQVPYSSAQQMKRAIIDKVNDELDEEGTTWYHEKKVNEKGNGNYEVTDGIVYSDCDPITHTEDMLRGNMRAPEKNADKDDKVARRSPLSISSMTPLHPELCSINRDVMVNDSRERKSEVKFHGKEKEDVKPMNYFPKDMAPKKASGVFQFNIELNLEKLFTLNIDADKNEIGALEDRRNDILEKAEKEGWEKVTLSNGSNGLKMPDDRIKEVLDALCDALLNWRIGSNQSLGFDSMNRSIVCIGDNPQKVFETVVTKEKESSDDKTKRDVKVYSSDDVNTYFMPTANDILNGDDPNLKNIDVDALDKAKEDLKKHILEHLGIS